MVLENHGVEPGSKVPDSTRSVSPGNRLDTEKVPTLLVNVPDAHYARRSGDIRYFDREATLVVRSGPESILKGSEPMKEALLVIDMQNGFIDPNGSMCKHFPDYPGVAGLDRAVAGCKAAIEAAHLDGRPVIYTRQGFHPGYVDAGVYAPGAELDPLLAPLRDAGGILKGTWDTAIIDELAPRAGDIVIDKTRFDSFLNTTLDQVLRHLGVRNLTLCGILTNFCVETTARGAFVRDYMVTVLGDACAAQTEREHEVSLESLSLTRMATVVRGAPQPVGAHA